MIFWTIKIFFSWIIGSEVGKFGKVSVSDCDETKSRCILKRGTNATVTIEFNISKSEICLSFSSFFVQCALINPN